MILFFFIKLLHNLKNFFNFNSIFMIFQNVINCLNLILIDLLRIIAWIIFIFLYLIICISSIVGSTWAHWICSCFLQIIVRTMLTYQDLLKCLIKYVKASFLRFNIFLNRLHKFILIDKIIFKFNNTLHRSSSSFHQFLSLFNFWVAWIIIEVLIIQT